MTQGDLKIQKGYYKTSVDFASSMVKRDYDLTETRISDVL